MIRPVLKSREWARENDKWASDEVRWRYREFELLDVPAPPVTAHGIAGTSHNCYHVEGAMALWLHLKPTGTWLKGREKARIDLTRSPSPTVNAHGMYGLGIHQFDLEDDMTDEHETKTDKPPYRIPLMGEIAKVRGTNGLKVVSTFSGAGGSCLGFEMAGYDVIWASEFVEAAREVHELNFPHCHVDPNDIRIVEPEEILDDIHMDRGEIDLLNGSPPCASFSQAGRREKTWGKTKTYSDTKQRSDDLFFEFARLVDGLQPRTFVAENVPGLGRGKAKGYLKMIAKRLRECGYKVAVRELDAQWLGVPQARKRLIFMGVRNDLPFDPVYPKPLPYRYTVADACPWIVRFTADQHGSWEPPDFAGDERPAPTVATTPHSAGYYHHTIEREDFYPDDLEPEDADTSEKGSQLDPEEEGCDISRFAIGAEWHNVKPGGKSDKYLNLVKAHPDKPSPTVTQTGGCSSAASVVCPDRPRKFTIPELKRICGFPDDFVLTGSYRQRWERLGRAVPPPMMAAVAGALAPLLLEHCR
jgi:DNA (cytosine-5)-methyltransferase 1